MLRAIIFVALCALSNCEKVDDPELLMSATEMIRYWGYPAEDHYATTKDGYILGLHRLPYGIKGPTPGCRPVVLLQHGLESDSTCWIANLPEQSAAFVFADAGFDVWLGNARGNTYSMNHVNLTSKDEKFWEFSWDEMGQYDIPGMIDYILQTTGQDSLYYVGHSQGTLTMFAMLSQDPEHSSKVKKFFALAPVGSVAHIQGALKTFCDQLGDDLEKTDARAFWIRSLVRSRPINSTRAESKCTFPTTLPAPLHRTSCIGLKWLSKERSTDSTGEARRRTTITMARSDSDWLADEQDIREYLLPALNPDYVKLFQQVSGFTHVDFMWGLRATADLYNPIIEVVKAEKGGTVQR